MGVGDSNALAWIIVALYAVAATVAFQAARCEHVAASKDATASRSAARDHRTLARLWLMLGVSMLALGANKQLDIQSLLIQIARDRALRDGWYEGRGQYRTESILLGAVVALAVAATLLLQFRRVIRYVPFAVAGAAVLALFIAIRATKVDDSDSGSTSRHVALELLGICLVSVDGVRLRRKQRTASPEGFAHDGLQVTAPPGSSPSSTKRT